MTLFRMSAPLIVGAALLDCGGRSALGEEDSAGAGAFEPEELPFPSEPSVDPEPAAGARSGRGPRRPRDRGGNEGGRGGARSQPDPIDSPTPPVSEDPLPCEVGPFACEGAELLTCRSELGGWAVSETCATGCLCQLGGPSGRCAMPGCARGEFRCDGALLEACNECRTGFGAYLLCSSPESCDAMSGSCLEP